MSAHAARSEGRATAGYAGAGYVPSFRARPRGLTLTRPSAVAVAAVALGTVLAAIAFVAGGGLSLGPATTVEISLTVAGGLAVAGLLVWRPASATGPIYGGWAVGLMFALAILTAVSVSWSVKPDDSWVEANRTLAYAAVFVLAVVWVRVAPQQWSSVLSGVALAAVAVSGWALLTKVFPGQLNPDEIYARLREPYGYWNAIGLTAALGVPALTWLGARRSGHAALNALAYPGIALLLVTLMLAFSRGALLALGIGLVFWFTAVPLRLRGAAVLLVSAAGAAVVVLWTFSQHALTKDRVALDERIAAGHQFGILLLAMMLVLLVVGLALNFAAARTAPSESLRRQAGLVLLVCLALVPVALIGALAASHRGLFGSISHDVSSLTDPHAKVPPNDPSRLTAIGSVRARYWNDALKAFKARPWLGNGAGGYATIRLRYREDTLNVQHAHGYIVQTLADLGLVGLAVSLALLAAWLAAALASTRAYGVAWVRFSGRFWTGRLVRRAEPFTPERIGLLTMLAVVVVFGVHSLVDWTWFVPGNACVALLCAGWLAGRGPLLGDARLAGAGAGAAGLSDAPTLAGAPGVPGRRAPGPPGARVRVGLERARARAVAAYRSAGPVRVGAAVAVIVLALFAAWVQWQPLRSVDAGNAALASVDTRGAASAERTLHTASSRDPLAVDPLFELAAVQNGAGQRALAHGTLIRAVRLQPSNPQTWMQLAGYDLYTLHDAKSALNDLRAALYLDPQNTDAQSMFVAALRMKNPSTPVTRAVPPVPPSNPGPVGPSG